MVRLRRNHRREWAVVAVIVVVLGAVAVSVLSGERAHASSQVTQAAAGERAREYVSPLLSDRQCTTFGVTKLIGFED
jgi:Mn2+/Fe2+ NRAMP family transporter